MADLGASSPTDLARLHEVLLGVAAERSPEAVLEGLVEAARSLVGARYAALGIPDGDGGFTRFLTAGIDEDQMEAIGPLPRVHGMLGAMLDDVEPTRLDDLTADPRFRWWPDAHPVMRSFLGVPVRARGEVVAAFYLTDKEGAPRFDEADTELISMLGAHAAIAIENANLTEHAREATTRAERERLARDLHDAMSQTLFSLQLTASTAAGALAAGDSVAAAEHLRTVRELASAVTAELRTLVVDLRPPDLAGDGLVAALAKQVHLLDRIHAASITLAADDVEVDERAERELWRIATEALANALRHADASEVVVTVGVEVGAVVLEVRDDGVGFDLDDVERRSTRLGLTSMRHRARAAGGKLDIRTQPGSGTTIRVEVPGG